MGMDLFNENGDYFRFSVIGWRNVLDLGQLYGWWPLGTEKPERWETIGGGLSWHEPYNTNQGQLVTRADAAALAAAIQDALDDIPDVLDIPKCIEIDPESHPLGAVVKEIEAELGTRATFLVGPNPDLTPFEFFGGDTKRKLVGFVEFCKGGGFRIF